MARGVRESAWSAGAFVVVLAVLVFSDERVRDRFDQLFTDPVVSGLSAGSRAAELGNAVLTAAREQSYSNGPLLIFTVVAVVLVLFMVRS